MQATPWVASSKTLSGGLINLNSNNYYKYFHAENDYGAVPKIFVAFSCQRFFIDSHQLV